jgi:hypothetical protein
VTLVALAAAVSLGLLAAAGAATPFTSATITKVENRVSYGERRGERSTTRLATISDIVRANNFLRSESNSRAELRYPDGTVVRIGQNTVFTFDAESRTLALEKGTMLFHIPKGSGGGTIKTASLTAAITGTAGIVSGDTIAITEGSIKLMPSGEIVNKGEFARRNANGSITIAKFDRSLAKGNLVTFGGDMPGFPESSLKESSDPVSIAIPELRQLDLMTRTQNLPGTINRLIPLPDVDRRRREREDEVPRPRNTNDDHRVTNY